MDKILVELDQLFERRKALIHQGKWHKISPQIEARIAKVNKQIDAKIGEFSALRVFEENNSSSQEKES